MTEFDPAYENSSNASQRSSRCKHTRYIPASGGNGAGSKEIKYHEGNQLDSHYGISRVVL